MNMKVSQLPESVQAAVKAQMEAITDPYRSLAKTIATACAAGKVIGDKAKETRKGLWSAFKDALNIAAKSGHSPEALRDGLSLACAEAEVPAGSFRSYAGTIGNLYAKVVAESLTLESATALSIKDARELCQSDADKQLKAMKDRFHEITKDYTVEQWADLITLIAPAQDEAEQDDEGETEEARTGTDG